MLRKEDDAEKDGDCETKPDGLPLSPILLVSLALLKALTEIDTDDDVDELGDVVDITVVVIFVVAVAPSTPLNEANADRVTPDISGDGDSVDDSDEEYVIAVVAVAPLTLPLDVVESDADIVTGGEILVLVLSDAETDDDLAIDAVADADSEAEIDAEIEIEPDGELLAENESEVNCATAPRSACSNTYKHNKLTRTRTRVMIKKREPTYVSQFERETARLEYIGLYTN